MLQPASLQVLEIEYPHRICWWMPTMMLTERIRYFTHCFDLFSITFDFMAKAGLVNLDYHGVNQACQASSTQMQFIMVCKPPPTYLPLVHINSRTTVYRLYTSIAVLYRLYTSIAVLYRSCTASVIEYCCDHQ